MVNRKITDNPEITTIANDDFPFHIVDIDDVDLIDQNKKITWGNIKNELNTDFSLEFSQFIDVNSTVPNPAVATGADSIAIGKDITVLGIDAIAIGRTADADGLNNIAIGVGSSTGTGDGGIAIGENATILTNVDSISLGTSSQVNDNLGGIAIGNGATVTGNGSGTGIIAIGNGASATDGKSIAIGHATSANASTSIALLGTVNASAINSIVIGDLSTIGAAGTNSVVIGRNSSTDGDASIVIGDGAIIPTGGDRNVVIGGTASSSATSDSVAIGYNNSSGTSRSVSIGVDSQTLGTPSNVAIGDTATASSESIAIGQNVDATFNSFAIGENSTASGENSIVLGKDCTAQGIESIAIGHDSIGFSDGSIGVGDDARGNNDDAIALGTSTQANGLNSVAIGLNAVSSATDAFQLGDGSNGTDTTIKFRDNIIANSDGIQSPTFSGVPSSTPVSGSLAVDSTNNTFYFRAGGKWCGVVFRETLTANRIYYVDPAGNDSNTGLAPGAGTAFQTIQRAVDEVAAIDPRFYNVTIQLADGTYDTGQDILLRTNLVTTPVAILGNPGTPANVIVTTTGATSDSTFNDPTGASWAFNGLTVQNSASAGTRFCLRCISGYMGASNMRFVGTGVNAGLQIAQQGIYTSSGSTIDITGTWPGEFINLTQSAALSLDGTTINLVSTPSFSSRYLGASLNSSYTQLGATITGTATGTRYLAGLNAALRTTNGLDTDIPGSVAGTLASGAVLAIS